MGDDIANVGDYEHEEGERAEQDAYWRSLS